MEEIYVNVECVKPVNPRRSTSQTGLSCSERRFHGAVVLSLGLLNVFLLAGIIILSVHYYGSMQRSANLAERHQASEDKLSSLTEERDMLTFNITEVTKELGRIESLCSQNITCPAGWRMFNWSCYSLSTNVGSWDSGRQDCRDRGTNLVVIESAEEQMFLSTFTSVNRYWIGLSQEQGTWKWVDGHPLTEGFWEPGEPNNEGGNEKCVHITTKRQAEKSWNDLDCSLQQPWICEKKVSSWCVPCRDAFSN